MTPERFRTLLEACGAEFRRWPEAEREAGRRLAQRTPELGALLFEAARLDGWLDAHAVADPPPALAARIVSGAPGHQARRAWQWLWPGAGLAGIGLAGSLAGAFAVSIALRAPGAASVPDWVERGSAFSELSPDWSEE